MNLSVLEDWVDAMGLPRGVRSHFAPVRDLLQWLQVSMQAPCVLPYISITLFPVPFVDNRFPRPHRNHSGNEMHQSSPGKFPLNGCAMCYLS